MGNRLSNIPEDIFYLEDILKNVIKDNLNMILE
jgi:hypothetical protein